MLLRRPAKCRRRGAALSRIALSVLVVDASLVVELSLDTAGERAGHDLDRGGQLIAPPLLWSEVPSALHEMAFRAEISNALAELALQRFLSGKLSISEQRPEGFATMAWEGTQRLAASRTCTALASPA